MANATVAVRLDNTDQQIAITLETQVVTAFLTGMQVWGESLIDIGNPQVSYFWSFIAYVLPCTCVRNHSISISSVSFSLHTCPRAHSLLSHHSQVELGRLEALGLHVSTAALRPAIQVAIAQTESADSICH